MTDRPHSTAFASVSINSDPEAELTATLMEEGSPLAGVIQLWLASPNPGAGLAVYLTTTQARQLRRNLSKALEAYYVEHPEQLGADIEADLTMDLVPDQPDPSGYPDRPDLEELADSLLGPAELLPGDIPAVPGEPPIPGAWRCDCGNWNDRGRTHCGGCGHYNRPDVSIDEAVQRG